MKIHTQKLHNVGLLENGSYLIVVSFIPAFFDYSGGLGTWVVSYSVIAGDRSLEVFNLELEEKLGVILVSVNGNSFPNQILFETLYVCIRRHILNVGLKLV